MDAYLRTQLIKFPVNYHPSDIGARWSPSAAHSCKRELYQRDLLPISPSGKHHFLSFCHHSPTTRAKILQHRNGPIANPQRARIKKSWRSRGSHHLSPLYPRRTSLPHHRFSASAPLDCFQLCFSACGRAFSACFTPLPMLLLLDGTAPSGTHRSYRFPGRLMPRFGTTIGWTDAAPPAPCSSISSSLTFFIPVSRFFQDLPFQEGDGAVGWGWCPRV